MNAQNPFFASNFEKTVESANWCDIPSNAGAL